MIVSSVPINTNVLNKVKVSLLYEEKSKTEKFLDATQLTIGRYLHFHKYRRRNLNTNLNIYSRESIFLLKAKNHYLEKFNGSRKNGGFDYIPCEGFFLAINIICTYYSKCKGNFCQKRL